MSSPASSQAHVVVWGGVALLGHSALNFLVVSGVTGFALPLVSLVVAYAGKLVNRGQSLPSYLVVQIDSHQ